jgi:methylated-DNA-[protein]-cysteine S-methyltransferase
MSGIIYWTSALFERFGSGSPVFLAATDLGLCRITWPEEGFDAITGWRDKHMRNAELQEDGKVLLPYRRQLDEYLNGKRRVFDIPLDLRGTPFQASVWKALSTIPYGHTCSYTDLAAAVGRPGAFRAAGSANGCNPVPIIVPCHRVIGKDGSLTGFRGGLAVKAALLKLEGVME